MLRLQKKRLTLVLALIMSITILEPVTTSAAYYTSYSERGIKRIAYSKNIISWSTNSSRIKSSDVDQRRSGLYIKNKGVKKLKSQSTKTRHVYNYKNEFLAGAVIGGVTLGWADTIVDQVRAYRTGKAKWYYNR